MNKIMRKSVRDQIDLALFRLKESGFPAVVQLNLPDGTTSYINFRDINHPTPDLNSLPDCCYGETLSFEDVVEAVRIERGSQDIKWGLHREQSLAGFIAVIEAELIEAKKGWIKNRDGKSAPLNEIVQIAAVCFNALERYGLTGSAQPTNDIPRPQ